MGTRGLLPSVRVMTAVLTFAALLTTNACSGQGDAATKAAAAVGASGDTTLPAGHPPVGEGAVSTADSGARGDPPLGPIKVRVKLSPALAAKAAPSDTVFVYARAVQGPRMPLAVVKKQVKDLPVTVTLDDSLAMTPALKLSNYREVMIGARVSRSGSASSQPGDLEGFSPPVASGDKTVVEVVIANQVTAPPAGAAPHAPMGTTSAGGLSHPKSHGPVTLDLPSEVKVKWKAVDLVIATGGKSQDVRVPVGGKVAAGGSGLTVMVAAFVPAFQSNAGTVTSSSNNPDNPAVLVRLLDKEHAVAEGWVFQKLPDFNTFAHERVTITLVAGTTASP